MSETAGADGALGHFTRMTRDWFTGAFAAPTAAQEGAWAAIARGDNTLVVAPTGSGKTLAAFLWSLDRLAAGHPATEPPGDSGSLRDAASPTSGEDAGFPASAGGARSSPSAGDTGSPAGTTAIADAPAGATVAGVTNGTGAGGRRRRSQGGDEPPRLCRVLYVSPLKALAVDIERNLRAPLAGLKQTARRLGLPVPEISVAIRSGDTSPRSDAGSRPGRPTS